jgi:hypothetical protein
MDLDIIIRYIDSPDPDADNRFLYSKISKEKFQIE